MPETSKIALLGATGQTGCIVLRLLLERPTIHINVYVRSRSKLFSQNPEVESSTQVSIFEGPVTDGATITACLRSCSTIINTLGGNDNRPATGLRDGATSIVSALKAIKAENVNTYQPPHVILLSSLTWNKNMQKQTPALIHFIVSRAFYYAYEDLLCAHKILGDEQDLLKLLLVQPPAIIHDKATGVLMSSDSATMTVSYEDLAQAFFICATDAEWRKVDAVVVSSKGGDNPARGFGLYLARVVIKGLCASYIPGFWMVHDWLFG